MFFRNEEEVAAGELCLQELSTVKTSAEIEIGLRFIVAIVSRRNAELLCPVSMSTARKASSGGSLGRNQQLTTLN